jgi:hypothetical protein
VAVRAIYDETGVLIPGISGWQRRDGLGYLGGSDRIINMPRGNVADCDRPGYLNEPGLIEPGIVHHLRGGHLHGEYDAAPRRSRVLM